MQRRGGGGGLGRGCGRISRGLAAVKSLDPRAEVYLFGSVAEDRSLLSSDIDVHVVTRLPPGAVLARLWEEGYKDPFEIHVVEPEWVHLYRKRSRLVRIEPGGE